MRRRPEMDIACDTYCMVIQRSMEQRSCSKAAEPDERMWSCKKGVESIKDDYAIVLGQSASQQWVGISFLHQAFKEP